jgi:predicted nucleotidyltransferase
MNLAEAGGVSAEARAEILRRLACIETDDRVQILLAVESGSRAWGFHSPDSDYDVRFVYVRSQNAYLGLYPPRDVIETPIDGLFDVNGWDLGKTLRLMIRGNSVAHEWLASPIVYRSDPRFRARMAPIARAWRSRYADAHHYYGLLASQWGRFIEGRERVNLKKYFYVIRPAVALQWLRERPDDSPPMDLPSLLEGAAPPHEAAAALQELRAAKQAASELGEGPRIGGLDAYIREQMAWGLSAKGRMERPDPALLAQTDDLLRQTVRDKG